MYYKEFLRVRHTIACVAIALGILVILQLISNLTQHGGPVKIQVDLTDHQKSPLSLFFAISTVVASIVAGLFAVSLGSENNGHLELAWTKPASRSRYALTLFAVDFGGIMVAFGLTFFASLFVSYLAGSFGLIVVDADAWPNLVRFLLLPFAWYGLIVALTASLRANCQTVAGLSWVGALILFGLGYAKLPEVWATIVKAINYLNPIAYAAYTVPAQPPYPFHAWEANAAGLFAIGILGASLALFQWRRLEA